MKQILEHKYTPFVALGLFVLFVILSQIPATIEYAASIPTAATSLDIPTDTSNVLDVQKYNEKILSLANLPVRTGTSTATSTINSLWPPKTPMPLAGAILPFKRVVAYYGNLYSKGMGVLGEYPEEQMLQMLQAEVKKWEAADPETPVQPALHYIASTAQASPGKEGLYTLRMPDSEIDKVLKMAKKSNAIVFLDLQIGLSNVPKEIPYIEKYLKMPNVHLGLDPEFSMKTGKAPGTVIGTMDATDINYAANYLAKLVKENNLPPKILVIHRFTQDMVTNYKKITPLPEVQIVMDMDGWGFKAKKINTYNQVIYPEPVQFTGFKLFYKNDLKGEEGGLMTPHEVLQLSPQPIYIQYQ
ncbi:MAG: hypothetical protein RLZZ517_622 [Candidatus Parcubacteria bacterium]